MSGARSLWALEVDSKVNFRGEEMWWSVEVSVWTRSRETSKGSGRLLAACKGDVTAKDFP